MVQPNWDGAKRSDRDHYEMPIRDDASRILSADMSPYPRIRGIDTVENCQSWLAVATDQETVDTDVIAALNKRIAELRDE